MIKTLKEFNVGRPFAQLRAVPVSLGNRGQGWLFIHSNDGNKDPWEEELTFPTDTLKLTLCAPDGHIMWWRDLGPGVIPGIWYSPVISFDLNGDGIDEIWTVGNDKPEVPFTLAFRTLEQIDPLTGETLSKTHWPTFVDTMSHSYRFSLLGGYVHGEPVLVCAQGTYADMYLQGYSRGLEKRWDILIPKNEPGARASHLFPVVDFDEDGIDEIFWGERILSVDDGHEIMCYDRDRFRGHSDIIIPFIDPETKGKYIYTCREGDERAGVKRVVTFQADGRVAWEDVDEGHMHGGWVANIGENRRRIAMAERLPLGRFIGNERYKHPPTIFCYDAVTGEKYDWKLPHSPHEYVPVDFDGDGYHELVRGDAVYDRYGNEIGRLGGGGIINTGKLLDLPGQQALLVLGHKGIIRIVGDDAAKNTAPKLFAEADRYHKNMQHFMGSGYNHFSAVSSCGI